MKVATSRSLFKLRWQLLVVVAVSVGAGIGIGTTIGGSSPLPNRAFLLTTSPVPSDLYVVNGSSGYATQISSSRWTVVVNGVQPIIWFSNRPQRLSGSYNAVSFASNWQHTFAEGSPNAAIIATAGVTGIHPATVTLGQPHWNVPQQSLTFSVALNAIEKTNDNRWLQQLTQSTAAIHGHIVLFIDNGEPESGQAVSESGSSSEPISGEATTNSQPISNASTGVGAPSTTPSDVTPTTRAQMREQIQTERMTLIEEEQVIATVTASLENQMQSQQVGQQVQTNFSSVLQSLNSAATTCKMVLSKLGPIASNVPISAAILEPQIVVIEDAVENLDSLQAELVTTFQSIDSQLNSQGQQLVDQATQGLQIAGQTVYDVGTTFAQLLGSS